MGPRARAPWNYLFWSLLGARARTQGGETKYSYSRHVIQQGIQRAKQDTAIQDMSLTRCQTLQTFGAHSEGPDIGHSKSSSAQSEITPGCDSPASSPDDCLQEGPANLSSLALSHWLQNGMLLSTRLFGTVKWDEPTDRPHNNLPSAAITCTIDEDACITNPGWISKSKSSASISSHLCTSSTSDSLISDSPSSLCSYCSSSPSGIRSSAKSWTPTSCRSLSILLRSGSNSAFLISCKTLC